MHTAPASAVPAALPPGVLCADDRMAAVWELVARVAPSGSTVLITGASGTGKELVARTLHRLSERRRERWVAVNCAAIPRDLMESELFGHERGAFTGASDRRVGRFEFAHGGTLFLDEVGCLPGDLQAKLLRVLQEREVTRVGGLAPIPVDVRVIAASNEDLARRVRDGGFREDLFYRLNVIPVELPPLRERPDDILPIARRLLERHAKRLDRPGLAFDLAAEAALRAYPWPGNVRELANVVERMAVLARGCVLGWEDVPEELRGTPPGRPGLFRAARAQFDRWLIGEALARSGGRVKDAAALLGLHRNTLHQRMDSLGLSGSARPARPGAAAGGRS